MFLLLALIFLAIGPLVADEGSVPAQFDWTWYARIKSGPALAYLSSGELQMKARYNQEGRLVEFWTNSEDLTYSERFDYYSDGKLQRHSL